MRLARWMGITELELEQMPYWYVERAAMVMQAEARVEVNARRRHEAEHDKGHLG